MTSVLRACAWDSHLALIRFFLFFLCAERLGQFSSGCRHVGVNDALVHVRQMLKRNPADEIRMRVDICLIFRLCRAELWCCGKNDSCVAKETFALNDDAHEL